MLDIGWSELFLIGVVALLVIGPKDLPRALYTAGKWMKAARKVTRDFQKHVDDMVRETELEEVRKGMQKVQSYNLKKQVEDTIDPKGEITSAIDPTRASNPVPNKKASADDGKTAQPRSGITTEPAGVARPRKEPVAAEPPPAEPVAASDKPV